MTSGLVLAAHKGSTDEVKRALAQDGADVNETDEQTGDTALHVACAKGVLSMVQCLVAAKADVNAQNKTGSTPLHKIAMSHKKPQSLVIVKLLLKKGADASVRNQAGVLPEQFAQPNADMHTTLLLSGAVKMTFDVPHKKHGVIIGKGGKRLREIQERSGTRISLTKGKDTIVVQGRPESAELAKTEILSITDALVDLDEFEDSSQFAREMEAEEDSEKSGPFVTTSVPLARDKHRLVIGPAGKTLRDLTKEFRVKIYVPDKDSGEDHIRLQGLVENVDKAIRKINAVVQNASPTGARRGGRGGRGGKGKSGRGGGEGGRRGRGGRGGARGDERRRERGGGARGGARSDGRRRGRGGGAGGGEGRNNNNNNNQKRQQQQPKKSSSAEPTTEPVTTQTEGE